MNIDVKIILNLMLKKGDVRELIEIMYHRTEAGERIMGLKKDQLFLFFFDQVD
jgi:hypothetical protein